MNDRKKAAVSEISINNEQHIEITLLSPSSQDWSRLAICKMFK